MKNFLPILLVLTLTPLLGWSDPITPGNVLFADPVDDQVVELSLDMEAGEAELIQLLTWPLLDTQRRRPLGLDVDPNGRVFVGVTGEPTSVTEEVEFPTGRVELVAINPSDGSITNYLDVANTNKATFLATSPEPNEVYIMSNAQDEAPSNCFRVKVEGDQVVESIPFTLSEELNAYGETLELPDGRILMGSNLDPGIFLFDQDGGEPTGMFVEGENSYRSLTYVPTIEKIIALRTDQETIDRFDLEGNLEDTINLGDFSYPNLWGTANVPGTTNIIFGSHNGPELTQNFIGMIDAADFGGEFQDFWIVGFDNVGLPDGHKFGSLFNLAVAVEFTNVTGWELY